MVSDFFWLAERAAVKDEEINVVRQRLEGDVVD